MSQSHPMLLIRISLNRTNNHAEKHKGSNPPRVCIVQIPLLQKLFNKYYKIFSLRILIQILSSHLYPQHPIVNIKRNINSNPGSPFNKFKNRNPRMRNLNNLRSNSRLANSFCQIADTPCRVVVSVRFNGNVKVTTRHPKTCCGGSNDSDRGMRSAFERNLSDYIDDSFSGGSLRWGRLDIVVEVKQFLMDGYDWVSQRYCQGPRSFWRYQSGQFGFWLAGTGTGSCALIEV